MYSVIQLGSHTLYMAINFKYIKHIEPHGWLPASVPRTVSVVLPEYINPCRTQKHTIHSAEKLESSVCLLLRLSVM